MDINQVKSGEFSAAQPISSHKYFSENQMGKHDKRQKTMGDSTRDGTFTLGRGVRSDVQLSCTEA